MHIGFDLDKVFINTPPLVPDIIIDKLYKKKSNGTLLYRIPSVPEQLFRRATHIPLLRQPIKENLMFLKSIPKKGNKLYIISSRYKFLETPTRQLIKRYGLDEVFDGLYFNYKNEQPHKFKNAVLKRLNLDKYVDDDLALLNYVAKENTKTKFYWLNYRGEEKILNKNTVAITKLPEIFLK